MGLLHNTQWHHDITSRKGSVQSSWTLVTRTGTPDVTLVFFSHVVVRKCLTPWEHTAQICTSCLSHVCWRRKESGCVIWHPARRMFWKLWQETGVLWYSLNSSGSPCVNVWLVFIFHRKLCFFSLTANVLMVLMYSCISVWDYKTQWKPLKQSGEAGQYCKYNQNKA